MTIAGSLTSPICVRVPPTAARQKKQWYIFRMPSAGGWRSLAIAAFRSRSRAIVRRFTPLATRHERAAGLAPPTQSHYFSTPFFSSLQLYQSRKAATMMITHGMIAIAPWVMLAGMAVANI